MTVRVIGPRDRVGDSFEGLVVNTTSRSKEEWSRGLSPFFLGPVDLYGGYISRNVENAWQFAKVYSKYVGSDGNPSPEYFEWASCGWADEWAHRYPMGRGAKPQYSWWDGAKLSYVEARKRIYIPLYSKAVTKTAAFAQLQSLYRAGTPLCLWDFDGYDHRKLGMQYRDVVNDPVRKMGHAFVLAMLLEGVAIDNL